MCVYLEGNQEPLIIIKKYNVGTLISPLKERSMKFKTEDVLIRLKKLPTTAFTYTFTDSFKNRNQSYSNVIGNLRKFSSFPSTI